MTGVYQLLPNLSDEEYAALKEDIAARGVQVPVEYDEHGNVLDGHHRLRACQELGIKDYPSVVRRFASEDEKVEHVLALNLHRRHLTREQRRELVATLRRQGWSTRRIAERLGIDHATVVRDIGTSGGAFAPPATVTGADGKTYPATRPVSVFARTPRERALATRALSALDAEALQAVGEGQMTVKEAYRQVASAERMQRVREALQAGRQLSDPEIMDNLGIAIQPYDVWLFQACDERFGCDYPGRIPGQLVAHCLYYWTEPGDLVVDPMAGSGTTLDVAKAMGRRCLAYDVRPARPDIGKHDLRDGWPPGTEDAALVFWDPPYFRKKDNAYSDDSISRLDRQGFLDVFHQAAATIPAGFRGRLAFLCSDYTDDEDPAGSIWYWDYIDIFVRHGWGVERRIQVPLSSQVVHPGIVTRFRQQKRLACLARDLVVFRRI